MIYVGTNIAQLNHFAYVASPDGEILLKLFKLANDGDGFNLPICKIESF